MKKRISSALTQAFPKKMIGQIMMDIDKFKRLFRERKADKCIPYECHGESEFCSCFQWAVERSDNDNWNNLPIRRDGEA